MPTPRSLISLLAAATLLATPVAAQEPDSAPIVETQPESPAGGGERAGKAQACTDARAIEIAGVVQARYDAIRDLAGSFEQTSQSAVLAGAALAEAESSRGKVVFAKPGKMRWEYEEPEPSLVVSDGKTLWIYDVAARQASKLPVEGGYLAGAALQFLLGEGNLMESFRIEALGCTEETVEIDLVPRADASYERLGLTARVADGLIVETTIVDIFGSRTRIGFDAVRFDTSPPETTFVFEPPDGVEVIDLAVQ